jgi:hypothetical protein
MSAEAYLKLAIENNMTKETLKHKKADIAIPQANHHPEIDQNRSFGVTTRTSMYQSLMESCTGVR